MSSPGFLLLVGLCGSFKVVLGLFGIEPDTIHSLMLWQGMSEHGLPWSRHPLGVCMAVWTAQMLRHINLLTCF
jgi:hypothetical protein